MTSEWISALRSVALELPDLARAEAFYTDVWKLEVAARRDDVLYLRGSGTDAYLLALHLGSGTPRVKHVTLRARSPQALPVIAAATARAGGSLLKDIGPLSDDPAGGSALTLRDPHGRLFQVVHGDQVHARIDEPASPDRPLRLAHAVLNSHDVETSQRFLERALGFVLADRTRIMAFMNCNSDHHSLAPW